MSRISESKEPSSFDDMTFIYKRFLEIIGLLPFENRHFSYLVRPVHVAGCLIWSTVYWSMIVFYMIEEYGKKALSTDSICESVLVVGVIARYYLLALHRLELARLLDECRAMWAAFDENGRGEVRKFEHKIRMVFLVLFGSGCFTNLMYSASAVILTVGQANQPNATQTRYLPYKWYTEEGPNLWPGYKIIFALQVLVVHNACIVGASVDSAGPFFIMIGAGYFRALQRRLALIADNDDSELVACSRLHQRILKFCSRIEKLTRSLFLVQLITTVYNISLLAFKLVGSDPDRFKYLPLTIYMLGQLFVCQWAPDHLVDESTAISRAAYSVSFGWMRRRLGKLLVLIIARSQKPVQMTAAGMVNLSLEKFNSMITSAFSFFTVLRNYSD